MAVLSPQAAIIETLFSIVSKEQEVVPFTLNPMQRSLDAALRLRMAIPKARQHGISSLILAYFTVACLGTKNARAVIISHESDATQRLLDRVHFYVENLRGPSADVQMNKNEVIFRKTDSTMWIGTAGSRKFGRGDMITHLHASEVAFWPNPKDIIAGLFQAVPRRTGTIFVESTGNGRGNWYHNLCTRAASGESSFGLHFLPFYVNPDYALPCTPEQAEELLNGLSEEWEEPQRVKTFNLTPGQILFRRAVLEELDFDLQKVNQEYPCELNDCFQAGGAGVFQKVVFVPTGDWVEVEKGFWKIKDHPKPGMHYVIGGDVAAGVGKDYSEAEVFCLEENRQVGEWFSNKTQPDIFAHKLAWLGKHFNEAYLGVESNNHGILTLHQLKEGGEDKAELYPSYKIYRTQARHKVGDVQRLVDLGFKTNSRSKPLIIGLLRKELASGLVIHSSRLRDQLASFIEHEDGSLGAAEGSHDDGVIAMAVAVFVKGRAGLALSEALQPPSPPPSEILTLDSYIQKLQGNRGGLPFMELA